MKLVNRDRYDFLSCASKSPLRSVTKHEHQTPNVWYRKAKPGKPGQNARRETPMQIVVNHKRPSLAIKTAPHLSKSGHRTGCIFGIENNK